MLLLCEDIDTDNNGMISLDEFVKFLQLEKIDGLEKWAQTLLILEIFLRLDETSSKSLDDVKRKSLREKMQEFDRAMESRKQAHKFKYVEFVAALYNFCTLEQKGLVRFLFDTIADDQGELRKSNIVAVVRDVLKTKDVETRVSSLLVTLDSDRSGVIDFNEFFTVYSRLVSLVVPLTRLHQAVKKKCVGDWYWKRQIKTRGDIESDLGLDPILIYHKIVLGRKVEPVVPKNDAVKEDSQPNDEEKAEEEEEDDKKKALEDRYGAYDDDDQEPAITAEEAQDVLDHVMAHKVDEQVACQNAGKRLQRILAGDDATDDRIETKEEPERRKVVVREGSWWIEHKRRPGYTSPEEKAPVTKETADILTAARKARGRAKRLEDNAHQRDILVDECAEENKKKSVLHHIRSNAQNHQRSHRSSSYCCCCYSSAVVPPQVLDDDDDDDDGSGGKSPSVRRPPPPPSGTFTGDTPPKLVDGRRITYTRQYTGLPPP